MAGQIPPSEAVRHAAATHLFPGQEETDYKNDCRAKIYIAQSSHELSPGHRFAHAKRPVLVQHGIISGYL